MADGKVVISTALDNSGLTKGIKAVSGQFGGLEKTVKRVAASIATAFSIKALATFVKSAADAYADYEQLIGGVETLFKDSADKVIDYAEDAFYTVGLSANEYMETVTGFSASLISSLAGDTAKAADVADMALTDMADNANKMGSTLESVKTAYQGFAKQNYTMLDNLKLGYGGTKTEMERLLVDAQKLTGVKYNINNLADVYNAIHAIQGEMGISARTAEDVAEIYKNTGREVSETIGTTAKEAEKTITGSANMTKAAWKNVLAAIAGGGDLDKAINNLVYSVTKYFDNMVPVVERSLSGVGRLIEQVAPQLVQTVAVSLIKALPNLLNAVYRMILGLGQGIREGISALISGEAKEISAQIGVADKLAEGYNNAADGASSFAGAITEAKKAAQKALAPFDEITKLATQTEQSTVDLSSVSGVSSTVNVSAAKGTDTNQALSWLDPVIERLQVVKDGFTGAFKADISLLQENWDSLVHTFSDTFFDPTVSAAAEDFFAKYTEALSAVGGAASSVATSFATGIVGGVDDAAQRLKDFNKIKLTDIAENCTNVADSISGISSAAGEIGKAFESEGFQGIAEFLSMLADVTIMEGLEKLTGFFSDQVALATEPIAENADKLRTTLEKIAELGDVILEPAKDLLEKMAESSQSYEDSAVHHFFVGLTDLASAGVGDALDEINEGLDGLIDLLRGKIDFDEWFDTYVAPAFSPQKWEEKAKTALEGIPSLFGEKFTEAANKVVDVFNDMIGWINGALSFTIPGFEIAGHELWGSKNVQLASIPQIPHLARGTVLPPNKPFMAVVGDQTNGTNVEAPLDTIRQALALELSDMLPAMIAGFERVVEEQQATRRAVENIEVGDTTIGEAANRYNAKMATIRGGAT